MSAPKPGSQTIRIPRPEEIVAHLSEAIKGHESTKRMLACAAYSHLLKCQAKSKAIRNVQSLENCLISGPTGSGKSAMLQRLASYLRMPVVTVLSGSLSPSGYRGKTCNKILDQIEEAAVIDGIMTPTICAWDELDKTSLTSAANSNIGEEADIYKKMVQSDMLGILQGIALSDRPGLDLGKVLHVAVGAFPEKPSPKTERLIGFHTPQEAEDDHPHEQVTPDYFITHGLLAELVGRFPRLDIMTKLTPATIRQIITESTTSSYKQKLWHFKQHGTELRFDDDALDLLAEKVARHPTGVRALQLVLNQLLHEFEYEITRSDRKSIEVIRYDHAAVLGTSEPIIVRSSTNNTSIERTIAVPNKKPSEDEEDHFGIF